MLPFTLTVPLVVFAFTSTRVNEDPSKFKLPLTVMSPPKAVKERSVLAAAIPAAPPPATRRLEPKLLDKLAVTCPIVISPAFIPAVTFTLAALIVPRFTFPANVPALTSRSPKILILTSARLISPLESGVNVTPPVQTPKLLQFEVAPDTVPIFSAKLPDPPSELDPVIVKGPPLERICCEATIVTLPPPFSWPSMNPLPTQALVGQLPP